MLEQRIKRVGQQPAGGLVARDQEGVDLVADVDVVELLAGRAVDAGHHRRQHVLLVVGRGGVLAALGDDLVDHLVHEGDVGGHVAPALLHPQVLHRQTADHHDGLERAHQRLHEGMVVAAVERVEAVVEAAEPDGVERQRGHVVDDVDLVVGVEPPPFLDQLLGDIDHARVIGLHGAVAERRQQDVVRLAPVRLGGVGGEQPVAARPRARGAAHLARPCRNASRRRARRRDRGRRPPRSARPSCRARRSARALSPAASGSARARRNPATACCRPRAWSAAAGSGSVCSSSAPSL